MKSLFYYLSIFALTISFLQAETPQRGIEVFFVDFDGVLRTDEPWYKQFDNVCRALSSYEVGVALWQSRNIFWNGAWNWWNKQPLFCDEQGKPLVGNEAHLQHFGKASPVIAAHQRDLIQALAKAKTMDFTIDMLQKKQETEDACVIVWTNNDRMSLSEKMKLLNADRRTNNKKEFQPDGSFVVDRDETAHDASPVAKPDHRYYQKAFNYSQSILEAKNIKTKSAKYYFIDDKKKNLDGLDATSTPVRIATVLRSKNDEEFMRNYQEKANEPGTCTV